MAGKPQVTLTFAGDATKLEKAFDDVGASSKTMGDDVKGASSKVRDSGAAFDRAGEAADNVDTKAMGFRDTMTGVQDTGLGLSKIMKGDLFEGFLTLGMGVGDLASGLFNFVIPSIKSMTLSTLGNIKATVKNTATQAIHKGATLASAAATRVMTVAQRALNLAMRANPLGLIITALTLLVGGIILAWKRSETFRRIVTGAFNAVKRAAQAVWNWIKNNWKTLLAIITGPIGIAVRLVTANWGRIKNGARTVVNAVKGFFRGLGNAITAPFRAAFSAVKSLWNSTVGGFGFTVPSFIPGIGGRGFRIPFMHTGGIVSGARGAESLAILQAGERVTPAGGGSQAARVGRVDLGEEIMGIIRRKVRAEGGNVQIVLGTG